MESEGEAANAAASTRMKSRSRVRAAQALSQAAWMAGANRDSSSRKTEARNRKIPLFR
jgi:hypothetical protein